MGRLIPTLFLLPALLLLELVAAKTRYFDWQIQYTDVTRLCNTKSLVSVNGEFPGPTVYVREGDKVVVNITNLVSYNVTIHWHGVRQLLSAWADGPAYITQCPIQTNRSYVHRFQVIGQRGTLFWHAHFSWLKATVYGGFIILKKNKAAYPFVKPVQEIPILIGEWWKANVEDVIAQSLASGGGYNISDAITINGQPGALYQCSQEGTLSYTVTQGKTYLLRVINAASNFQMFFSVAGHTLTVVEADAQYTEPYTTDVILLAPGQTTNVLLTASSSVGQYYIAASIYSPPNIAFVPFPQTPATAILIYEGAESSSDIPLPIFPLYHDTAFATNFTESLRSLPSSAGYYSMKVPQQTDVDLLYTVGYALRACPQGQRCAGPLGNRLGAAINNISFSLPSTSILQAYYNQINGVYTTGFADIPPFQYNYTGVDPDDKFALVGTQVKVLPFNSTVQVVFQDTATLLFEEHPIHLHGQDFYIVGNGFGNFDSSRDPANFNLVNPPLRNTISVRAGGWTAVRFQALNPGVWFVHCHLDIHQSWGMDMAFITLNGAGEAETLPPPPADLPPC